VADRDPTCTPDPADVELVAKAFIAEAKKNPVDTSHYSWGVTSRLLVGPNEFDIARAVLAALAAAGRLLPADAETRTEYGVRMTWDDGTVEEDECDRRLAERRVRWHAERRAAVPGWRIAAAEVVTRVRTTTAGPWLPEESGS
jgi:hypothetical protein